MAASSLRAKLSRIRTWTRLGISRRQYESKRPWSGTGLTRDEFEHVVDLLPDHVLQEIRLDGDAERLLRAALGDAK